MFRVLAKDYSTLRFPGKSNLVRQALQHVICWPKNWYIQIDATKEYSSFSIISMVLQEQYIMKTPSLV